MKTSTLTRVDTLALFAALEEARKRRGLSWRELAAEIGYPAITDGMLRQTGKGGLIGIVQFMAYTDWLGVPAETFLLRPDDWRAPDGLSQLLNLLRAQKELSPDRAARLERAVREVWEQQGADGRS